MTTRLTDAELDELEAKAKAATPGPWRHHDMESATVVAGHPGGEVANCLNGFGDQETNSQHIAAANPEAILRLIDMVERRDEQIKRLQGARLMDEFAVNDGGCWTDEAVMKNTLSNIERGTARVGVSAEHYRWLAAQIARYKKVVIEVYRDPLNSKFEIAREALAATAPQPADATAERNGGMK